MLVMSMKPDEAIIIDGGITVTMVQLSSNQVRLGIDAPADVQIIRSELLARKPGAPPGRAPRLEPTVRHPPGGTAGARQSAPDPVSPKPLPS